MITALSCLTLEIYYRYLPLYKVDAEDNSAAGGCGPRGQARRQGRRGQGRPTPRVRPARTPRTPKKAEGLKDRIKHAET